MWDSLCQVKTKRTSEDMRATQSLSDMFEAGLPKFCGSSRIDQEPINSCGSFFLSQEFRRFRSTWD